MASNDPIMSRRGVLGGIVLVSTAATAPSAIAHATSAILSTRPAWDAALADYLRAKAIFDATRDTYTRDGRMTDARSDELERLSTAYCDAQDALLAMPAPDLKAALWKLEYFLGDDGDGFTSSWRRDLVAPVLHDVRRLAA